MKHPEDALTVELPITEPAAPKRSSHVETALRHLTKDRDRLTAKRDDLNKQIEAIDQAIMALRWAMSKTVNKVILLGNLGRDPDIKTTGGGTLVAGFSIATSQRRKDANGNWQDNTEWHSLIAFGRTAEIIRDYVKKGSSVYIEGRLQTRSWDKDGSKQYRTDVVVEELVLLGKSESKSTQTAQEPIEDPDIPF